MAEKINNAIKAILPKISNGHAIQDAYESLSLNLSACDQVSICHFILAQMPIIEVLYLMKNVSGNPIAAENLLKIQTTMKEIIFKFLSERDLDKEIELYQPVISAWFEDFYNNSLLHVHSKSFFTSLRELFAPFLPVHGTYSDETKQRIADLGLLSLIENGAPWSLLSMEKQC